MLAPTLAPGFVLLDKYRVDQILPHASMGVIVRARHVLLDIPVAIKLLTASLLHDHVARVRFLREARATSLVRGEHVVAMYDAGCMPDGAPYLVMEWVDGCDLERTLAAGPMHPARAALLGLQICAALAKGHMQGIVHRDLKPANVMLTFDDEGRPHIKVLDFGIAKLAKSPVLTAPTTIIGTPHYMAPEQVRSRAVDQRTDIYAIGAVLYELIEGRSPFTADTLAALCFQICEDEPLPTVRAPRELSAVIERCLAKDPDHRYANVIDLAAALMPWADDAVAASALWRKLWRAWQVPTGDHHALRVA